MTNYRRAYHPGGTFFFTVVTYRRRKILTLPESRKFLRQAIQETQKKYPFQIDAWVLLEDHLHCIWKLPDSKTDFSIRWRLIKQRFTQKAKSLLHKNEWMNPAKTKRRESTIWQRRFWEHQITDDEDYLRHVDYLHYNPVKHGLVKDVKAWPYSTFHKFVKMGIYPENWGGGVVPELQSFRGE